jgi:chemotaxis protein methyltransferase CheR
MEQKYQVKRQGHLRKEKTMNDKEYSFLKNIIREGTNLDINCYKGRDIRRRIDEFVGNSNQSVTSFCAMLETSPGKQRELLDYLAINVYEFFYDPTQFKNLRKVILPELFSSCRRLNIWSAGCYCGQEPYSLAMVLNEITPGYNHRIVATDIDESALRKAKNGGPYLPFEVRNLEKSTLEKYFNKNDAGYWVNDMIRNKITVQFHDMLDDSLETNFDLIVCRKVTKYFSETVRNAVFKKFHNSLKVGGVLFLAGSEVLLKPDARGFDLLIPSFYRKSTHFPETIKPVPKYSEAIR